MKRKLSVWIIIIWSAFIFTSAAFAPGKDAYSPIVNISSETAPTLQKVKNIAIFLNGNDLFLNRLLEDSLAICLAGKGFKTVSREKIEKILGEEMGKKKKEEGGSINAIDIGKMVNADAVLTGTAIIEVEEQKAPVVRVVSFQLIYVETGATLISMLIEPQEGKSFSETAGLFVNTLKENIR